MDATVFVVIVAMTMIGGRGSMLAVRGSVGFVGLFTHIHLTQPEFAEKGHEP
jgi:hypothetical protein